MRAFDPASSFGPETAAQYDGFVRGTRKQRLRFWRNLPGEAVRLSLLSGRVASPLCWLRKEFRSTELNCLLR
jgi:type IV secretory pathway VirB9-like protein